jgi:hypothetical protein
MTQDQIHTAGYTAGNIAKAMDRAWWMLAYDSNSIYAPHHVAMAHEAFAELAAAMGYTIALIEATDAEVIE